MNSTGLFRGCRRENSDSSASSPPLARSAPVNTSLLIIDDPSGHPSFNDHGSSRRRWHYGHRWPNPTQRTCSVATAAHSPPLKNRDPPPSSRRRERPKLSHTQHQKQSQPAKPQESGPRKTAACEHELWDREPGTVDYGPGTEHSPAKAASSKTSSKTFKLG